MQRILPHFFTVNHQQEYNDDINEVFWDIELNRVEPPQMLIINDDYEPYNFDDHIRLVYTAPAAWRA